jgi:hypothetical protein
MKGYNLKFGYSFVILMIAIGIKTWLYTKLYEVKRRELFFRANQEMLNQIKNLDEQVNKLNNENKVLKSASETCNLSLSDSLKTTQNLKNSLGKAFSAYFFRLELFVLL